MKRIITLVTAIMFMLTCIPALAEGSENQYTEESQNQSAEESVAQNTEESAEQNAEESEGQQTEESEAQNTEGSEAPDTEAASNQYTWDMTALSASKYTASAYTAVDNMISLKAAPDDVTADGIKLTKSNNARIMITPIADGTITITYTGGAAVLPDRENRRSSDETIVSDTPLDVVSGKVYYLQGSASGAAVIKSIVYASDSADMELIPIQDPGEDPSEPPETSTPPETETPTPKPTATPQPTAAPKPTALPDMVFDNDWDLTGLTASDYNADSYVDVNDIISVKAASGNVSGKGISVSKSNNVKIKIMPEADGQIMISYTGSGSVIVPDHEERKSSDTAITQNELIDVYAGVEYYIQGTSSSAAEITAIHFKAKEFVLLAVTGIGFSEDYTRVLEFDVEKGDDYEYDMVACVCVYDDLGTLKSVGTRKILASSLNIGTNTVKCDIDISGYSPEGDTVKIFLWSGLS